MHNTKIYVPRQSFKSHQYKAYPELGHHMSSRHNMKDTEDDSMTTLFAYIIIGILFFVILCKLAIWYECYIETKYGSDEVDVDLEYNDEPDSDDDLIPPKKQSSEDDYDDDYEVNDLESFNQQTSNDLADAYSANSMQSINSIQRNSIMMQSNSPQNASTDKIYEINNTQSEIMNQSNNESSVLTSNIEGYENALNSQESQNMVPENGYSSTFEKKSEVFNDTNIQQINEPNLTDMNENNNADNLNKKQENEVLKYMNVDPYENPEDMLPKKPNVENDPWGYNELSQHIPINELLTIESQHREPVHTSVGKTHDIRGNIYIPKIDTPWHRSSVNPNDRFTRGICDNEELM